MFDEKGHSNDTDKKPIFGKDTNNPEVPKPISRFGQQPQPYSKYRGNLAVPDGAKIRDIEPERADPSLCSQNKAMIDVPLFEHDPCVDDIQQTELKDSYLLGSLISLINSPEYGPESIKKMMLDNGDGTVTVRLYDFDVDPDSQNVFMPIKNIRAVYIIVKKGGDGRNSSSALWVQVLENAYAALGCNKYVIKVSYYMNEYGDDEDSLKQKDKGDLDAIRTLNDINGGYIEYAMFALTGETADYYDGYNYNIKITPQDIKTIYNKKKCATIVFKESTKSVVSEHTYSIYDIFEIGAKTYITIINPRECSKTFEDFTPRDISNISSQTKENDKVLTFLLDENFTNNIDCISTVSFDEDLIDKLKYERLNLNIKKDVSPDSSYGNLVVPEDAKIRGPESRYRTIESSLCSPIEYESIKEAPLFEHEPCVEDVQQTKLGDCYLLASLISLINSPEYGRGFIKDMMIDNGDGTVTVRLYKFKYTKSPAGSMIRSIKPVYIRVKKGGVFKDPYSALWVQVLENAFARLRVNKYQNKDWYYMDGYGDKADLTAPRTLDDIIGGNEKYAIFALTGELGSFYDCGEANFTARFIKHIYEKTKCATISFKEDTKSVVGKHAYSIYDVFEKDGKTYITIINPWLRPMGYDFKAFKENPSLADRKLKRDKVLTFELNYNFLRKISGIKANKRLKVSKKKTRRVLKGKKSDIIEK